MRQRTTSVTFGAEAPASDDGSQVPVDGCDVDLTALVYFEVTATISLPV